MKRRKKKEWNDGDATLHSMPASRILPHLGTGIRAIHVAGARRDTADRWRVAKGGEKRDGGFREGERATPLLKGRRRHLQDV